jgi:hypothetical protein
VNVLVEAELVAVEEVVVRVVVAKVIVVDERDGSTWMTVSLTVSPTKML